jgi:hypothetical protein
MAGIFERKPEKSPEQFWDEYGARYGETVLSYGLGRYVSGWDEFSEPLWGLLIATSGGFRFHHFPHQSWLQALVRPGSADTPEEKTLFIPRQDIAGVELLREENWLKKLIFSRPPLLRIRYSGNPGEPLVFETDTRASALVGHLS